MNSDFPEFPDGDTKIVVSGTQQYLLHSSILSRSSPVLRSLLQSPAPLSKQALKKNITTLYKLVLVDNTDTSSSIDPIDYVFKAVEFSSDGRPVKPVPCNPFDNENGRSTPGVLKAFDDIFGAFYNRPIEFGDNLAEMLGEAQHVAEVAEYLQCTDIVTKPIEASLLSHGQLPYQSISAAPIPWICFAYRIRSRTIFEEALIHAAGRYQNASVQHALREGNLPPDVVELINDKGKAILDSVRLAVHRISAYYPSMLKREKPIGRVDMDKIGRASYANDVLAWIALTVFRHWINDQMNDDHCHHSADMGYAFLAAICAGGETYLSRETLADFHTIFPMTDKGKACVEHRLNEIKDTVKQWAMPLMRNESKLDASAGAIDHFLHTRVKEDDITWLRHPSYERDMSDDETYAITKTNVESVGANDAGNLYTDDDDDDDDDDDASCDGPMMHAQL